MRPHVSRKLHGHEQPGTRHGKQYHIYKVSAHYVIRNGERKEPIRGSLSDCALNRAQSLRETICGTE